MAGAEKREANLHWKGHEPTKQILKQKKRGTRYLLAEKKKQGIHVTVALSQFPIQENTE